MDEEKIAQLPIPDSDEFDSDPDEITLNLRRSQTPVPEGERPRVLLVDDDPQVLRMTVRLLGQQCEVETAASAEEAVQLLYCKSYHVVISDHDMPGRDGLWLLGFVARRHPDSRRVIYSGCEPDVFQNALASGLVQHHLPKPATRTEILLSLTGS